MTGPLDKEAIEERLRATPGWEVVEGRLHRGFTFADFSEAFGFMTRVALVAEQLDHHPDWSNSWNKVMIDIVSHAAGGITDQCFELAGRINQVAPSA
jgi:4a-hydroxytetrahydrobiopterin dehydratase